MIFAQIKDDKIVNTITIDSVNILPLFLNDPITNEPFDFVLQIDFVYPQPGIGWTFDRIRFIPPEVVEVVEEPEDV
jgi:hypothetical protein